VFEALIPPHDKCLHAIGGTVLAVHVLWLGLPLSIASVVAIAVGYEIWQHFQPPSKFDIWDAVATVLGGLPVWIVWSLR
jgi:hypothetical protein